MFSRVALRCSSLGIGQAGRTPSCQLAACCFQSTSAPTNLNDVEHTKFRFEKGKFSAAKSGEATGSKTLQMVRGALKGVGKTSPPDEITHTGQSYDGDDYRRNRFIDRKKLVNPNWGIDMVAEVAPIAVAGRVAVCDGTGPYHDPNSLGHPRVYINLDKPGPHSCPYCGLRYYQKHGDDEEK